MVYQLCKLSRKVGIGYTSARLNARKIKYAMMMRNMKYNIMDNVLEHDEILIGTPTRNGKRGLGSEKQKAFMNVGIENNVYPTYIKITLVDDSKNATIKERLLEIIDKDKTVTFKTDGKAGLGQVLQPQFISDAIVHDYEHLHWLNTITSNLKTYLLGVYQKIAKKYLRFAIAEFE